MWCWLLPSDNRYRIMQYRMNEITFVHWQLSGPVLDGLAQKWTILEARRWKGNCYAGSIIIPSVALITHEKRIGRADLNAGLHVPDTAWRCSDPMWICFLLYTWRPPWEVPYYRGKQATNWSAE